MAILDTCAVQYPGSVEGISKLKHTLNHIMMLTLLALGFLLINHAAHVASGEVDSGKPSHFWKRESILITVSPSRGHPNTCAYTHYIAIITPDCASTCADMTLECGGYKINVVHLL